MSDEDFPVINIASGNPKNSDHISAIGNPGLERFVITYGSVKIKILFSTNSDIPENAISHTAYTVDGNSGAAVLNDEMKIVGITVGGFNNIFGRFRSSIMIPAESVQDFLKQWTSE